jgi:hypothetical protein
VSCAREDFKRQRFSNSLFVYSHLRSRGGRRGSTIRKITGLRQAAGISRLLGPGFGQLIDLISSVKVGDKEARAEGKKGGEFYTPRCVVKLLVESRNIGQLRRHLPSAASHATNKPADTKRYECRGVGALLDSLADIILSIHGALADHLGGI